MTDEKVVSPDLAIMPHELEGSTARLSAPELRNARDNLLAEPHNLERDYAIGDPKKIGRAPADQKAASSRWSRSTVMLPVLTARHPSLAHYGDQTAGS
jgi:hypothetical protein